MAGGLHRDGSEPAQVCIVVPCRNEAASIAELAQRLSDALAGRWDYEVVFVDDGSIDATVAVLRDLAAQDPRVGYLSLSRGFGKESAMLAGLEESRSPMTVLMDGDLQHPPEVVPSLLERLASGDVDQVVAVRSRAGEGPARRLLSRIFGWFMARNSDLQITSGHGDFRAMSRRVVDGVLQLGEANRFSRGLLAWVGYDVVEIPFDDPRRDEGASRWSFGGLVGYGVDAVLSFNERPLRVMLQIGWFSVVVFFAYLLYLLVSVAAFGIETPGYVTVVASIFFFGGLQLMSIGLLGEYLGRIYLEVKDRPHFLLRERSVPGDRAP